MKQQQQQQQQQQQLLFVCVKPITVLPSASRYNPECNVEPVNRNTGQNVQVIINFYSSRNRST